MTHCISTARTATIAIAAILALPAAAPVLAKQAPPADTGTTTATTTISTPPPSAIPAPIVNLTHPPTPAPTPVAAKPAAQPNETELMIGGGALALLALAGAGLALSRRKRRSQEAEAEAKAETTPVRDPIFAEQQPPLDMPAASAFAWDKAQPCDQPSDDGSDRCPGETWVERAHRGPSPANPSMSLKHRLSRAAFFDKREREVAAGTAERLDPSAGLPDAMVEEQERELG